MLDIHTFKRTTTAGPPRESLTLEDLPPPQTDRWVVRRKAEVVAAVSRGLLTIEQACDRYSLSVEEFTSWQRAIDRRGMPGLRVTRLKEFRDQDAQRPVRIEAQQRCSIRGQDGDFRRATLLNLSDRGFCFSSSDHMDVGEQIEIQIGGMGQLEGTVRWSHDDRTGGVLGPYVQGAYEVL